MKYLCLVLLLGRPWVLEAQTVPVWKYSQLEEAMQPAGDTVKVINFWATWCAPCVAELPAFADEAELRKGQKVKFYFVSLDFKKDIQSKVTSFLKRRPLPGSVALLDELDYNNWIPKVNRNWEGNIPATLFVQGKKKVFNATQLSRPQIGTQIEALLQAP